MVQLAATNRTKIGKARETTYGVVPTSPVFKTLRVTGEPNLSGGPKTVVSNEIRSDRQTTDIILVALEGGGDLDAELSFGAFDDDFEEAVMGTWSAKPTIIVATLDTEISDVNTTTLTVANPLGTPFVAGMLVLTTGFTTPANNNIINRVASNTATTIVFPAASFTVEGAAIPVGAAARVVGFMGASGDIVATLAAGIGGLTSTLLDFTTLGLVIGEWAKVGGTAAGNKFATAGCNDWVRISAIAAHVLTFDRVPVGWAADAGTAKTVQFFTGDVLVNSSTVRSNTIERQYLDHSPVSYELLPGEVLDKFSIDAKEQSVPVIKRTYMGAGATASTTRSAGATDIAPPTYAVLNTSSNVGRIGLNGVNVIGPNYLRNITIEYNNNIRRQPAIGSLAAVGIGEGQFEVSGTVNAYFGDITIYNQVLANTKTSLDMRVVSAAGNREGMLFDFPSVKWKSGAPVIAGKNQDVMISAGWEAYLDVTYGYTALIQRFYYTPA